jgi:DNA-binding transcriptional LysR family regulator
MTDLEIRYFLEIVNNDVSFTKTANALYVSQPALTKHINKLGEELGVKLFDTSKKHATRLTPAGSLYYQFFSEYKDKLKKIMDEAKALVDQEYGEIRIACLSGWNMLVCQPKKQTFFEAYPHIKISLVTGGLKTLKNGLLNNQYDLVVAFSDQFQGLPNIQIHDHYHIPCILLFSSQHSLAGKKNITIMDFRDDIFYIVSDDETHIARQNNEAYCKSKGFIPRFQTLPNLDTMLLALQSGNGYTIIDEWIWAKDNPNFNY